MFLLAGSTIVVRVIRAARGVTQVDETRRVHDFSTPAPLPRTGVCMYFTEGHHNTLGPAWTPHNDRMILENLKPDKIIPSRATTIRTLTTPP